MRRIVVSSTTMVAAAVLIGLSLPRAAHAQMLRAGGTVGMEFDSPTDFMTFGAEARGTLSVLPIEIDPRFFVQPASGGSMVQFDLNALYDLQLKQTNLFVPYAGTGIAIQHYPGTTAVGYNLVFGGEVNLPNSPWQPFAQFEYTVILHQPNSGNAAFGIMYNFSFVRTPATH